MIEGPAFILLILAMGFFYSIVTKVLDNRKPSGNPDLLLKISELETRLLEQEEINSFDAQCGVKKIPVKVAEKTSKNSKGMCQCGHEQCYHDVLGCDKGLCACNRFIQR